MYILLLMRSSSEWPVLSLSVVELAVLSRRRDDRLLTGLRLAYNDLGRAPTLRVRLPRVLELRPPDPDLRRLLRLADARCAPETYYFCSNVNPLMGTLKRQNNGPLYSSTVYGWAVTFGTARRGLGGLRSRPVPSSLYQM